MVAVRQQVDVVAERGGRLVVAVLPLVDDADGVVELGLARREPQRLLRFDQRVGEAAARGQRAGAAVVGAGLGRSRLERRLVGVPGFVEQAEGPERVAVERLRRARRRTAVGSAARPARALREIAGAQQHQREARARPPAQRQLRRRDAASARR